MRIERRTAACLAVAGLLALGASAVALAAPDPRVAGALAPRGVGSRTNTELLVAAARAVAARLAAVVPISGGTRIALQPEGHDPVDTDVSEALLLALNARGFECLLLTPLVVDTTTAALPPPDSAAAAAAAPTTPGSSRDAYLKLQDQRRAQQARADSIAQAMAAHAAAAPASHALAAGVPLLTYRVAEGRVDYVLMFRSGIFGAERIERRATTRVTLKLHAPGDEAVRWSTSADTTLGDVVNRTELSALEDRMRPETRPLAPQSNLKKIIEPALVVALIAGLVALFYQNRP